MFNGIWSEKESEEEERGIKDRELKTHEAPL